MQNQKLQNLTQGLMMAAVVAGAMALPDAAFAQLNQTANTSQNTVFTPLLTIFSYGSYLIGAVLAGAGIMHIKRHTENATSNPLNQGLGKLGAGAAFLALPSLMGVLNQTGSQTLRGTATFTTFGF